MKKNFLKLIALLLIIFTFTSCVKTSSEGQVNGNLKSAKYGTLEITKEEKEIRDFIYNKSIIYSSLTFEEKKDYYNKIFYLFESTNNYLRGEVFTYVWAILRSIKDNESDVLDFLQDKALSDEGIFYKIGSENTNDVLVRSYSLKVITSLINRSNTVETIDKNDLIIIKNKLIEYIYLEKDRRGYIKDIGESYSFNNWVDAICAVINVLELTEEDEEELIKVLKDQLLSPYTSFNSGEDEILAFALSKLILSSKDTIRLQSFLDELKVELNNIYKNDMENYVYVSSNVYQFLKTFYYRTEIMVTANKEPIQELIKDSISINSWKFFN